MRARRVGYLCARQAREVSRDNHKWSVRSEWPAGCAPPTGYLAWHSWAEAQTKHGLRQKQCARCGLWMFPQEKPAHMTCERATKKSGPLTRNDQGGAK
jgi:hypothetical protein